MKNIAKMLLPVADLVISPFVYPAALILTPMPDPGMGVSWMLFSAFKVSKLGSQYNQRRYLQ